MFRHVGLLLFFACTFSCFGEDEVTVSPSRTFEIVQTDTPFQGMAYWKETLHFLKSPSMDVGLEYGISWPALFYISPDDQWILRVQKSGSGDNISYLYQVNQHIVWRMKEQIGQLGFDFLDHQPGGVPGDLYHTGIEFSSWDIRSSLLHFTVHGSGNQSGSGIHQPLTYDLKNRRILSP